MRFSRNRVFQIDIKIFKKQMDQTQIFFLFIQHTQFLRRGFF